MLTVVRAAFAVTVALRSPTGGRRRYGAEFLVDTGATDSLAPAPALRRAGIRTVGKTSHETALESAGILSDPCPGHSGTYRMRVSMVAIRDCL